MIDTIEIKWDLLGAKLARLSDHEQGLFFKGFARELDSYESNYKMEMQMFFIKDKLTKQEQNILENALSCLWYEEVRP
jgi:hypothetical protein